MSILSHRFTTDLHIEGYPEPIRIRPLTVDDLDDEQPPEDDRAGSILFWATRYLADDKGERLVKSKQDQAKLRRIPLRILTEVVEQGMRQNGLDLPFDQAKEQAGKD